MYLQLRVSADEKRLLNIDHVGSTLCKVSSGVEFSFYRKILQVSCNTCITCPVDEYDNPENNSPVVENVFWLKTCLKEIVIAQRHIIDQIQIDEEFEGKH